ncbi:apolipoprotein N-acyltransferase [Ruixingdingia sedimenti]|uniref:Apolipoprotein N-acyltransferase n=1 Tax=Ruixingdingia sedimenti TaxID=3073604 RepID=A0ABU1F7F1_9RHOB|nr:apolipoprotein N-acyltransferase [Xinfangfangia sp. LG-4]MDR5652801.1 apolipoprotein N-acyltransferase [Xinfangfangia sp. LG-4]
MRARQWGLGLSRPRALMLAALLGALAALGQVPFSLWFVALPAWAAGLALIAAAPRPGLAAGRAWLFGAGHFAVALHWIVEPFQVDPARDGWMAPFALVGMAFGLALFWAGAGWLAARVMRDGPGRALALVAALSLAEFIRGHIFTGFPWALPGHIWIGLAPMQLAAWVGAYGLTLLTLLAVALPAAAGWRGGAVGALLVAGMAAAGYWQGAQPVPPAPGPVVRLVQPNAIQSLKWDPDWAREFFGRQIAATAAPGDRRPDLIVWPETAVPFLLNDPGRGLDLIAEAADGVPVALGIQRTEGWRGFNSLAVLATDGAMPAISAVYDKHHLVPFGEYIPFGDRMADWFGIIAFAAQEGHGYSAGPGPELIDLGPLGRALPLICYEAVFPQDIRRLPRADWLLQVTNDAWFGDLAGPWQHLSLARLRAVEQGLPLMRAANTGVTAVVDARGRVLAQMGLGEVGHLDAPLPAALPPTVYARAGEWPFFGLLATVALFAAIRRRRRD